MATIEEKFRALRVSELKDLLSKNGLPVSGKKEDLVGRLLAAGVGIEQKTMENDNTYIETNSSNKADKPVEADLDDKDLLTSPTNPTSAIDGDFDWDDIKLTTEELNEYSKDPDPELDSLISPSSPSLSVSSAKDKSTKIETPISEDNKQLTSSTPEKPSDASEPEIVVKSTGFQCQKITFSAPLPVKKQDKQDLNAELERRKKRAERFGTALSESDKKLERAVRFGIKVTSPLDSPLKAERPRKPSAIDEEKLRKRAEKFGLPVNTSTTSDNRKNSISSLSEEEKKKLRAQRFGTEGKDDELKGGKGPERTSHTTIDKEEEEKKRKRVERLGLPIAPSKSTTLGKANTSPTTAKESADSSLNEVEKRRKRAERFGTGAVGSESPNKKVKV